MDGVGTTIIGRPRPYPGINTPTSPNPRWVSRLERTGSPGSRSLQRIYSIFARKRGLNRTPGLPVHDDLVARPLHRFASSTTADPTTYPNVA